MIAHIRPASTSFEESGATLIYAYKAKNIKTRMCMRLQVLQVLQLENTNIELHIDTSRHLITITDLLVIMEVFSKKMCCSEHNTSYGLQCNPNTFHYNWEQDRARHDKKPRQKIKRNKAAENKLADSTDEENEEDDGSSTEPHEVTVAREEISMLLAEQRKTASLKNWRNGCQTQYTKLKASQLERLFPKEISSEEQQEVLRLLCRVHELEVGNTELQAKALCKENLLCQKDFAILHYQQYSALCEVIIQLQQTLIEGDTEGTIGDVRREPGQGCVMKAKRMEGLEEERVIYSVKCS
ncbi:hypothetical protein XELAEV_18047546mg [Xenopus laevis]|uniref:Kinesin motor domain-containing protein n=1 Tax=Xenopus laevis TaxID=8355 RepID=A0A974H1J1_XENLA|nr:hypothetical protein XELAEV_18047546mg [Xenopus laevis]